VGAFATGEEALRQLPLLQPPPDLVVVDLHLKPLWQGAGGKKSPVQFRPQPPFSARHMGVQVARAFADKSAARPSLPMQWHAWPACFVPPSVTSRRCLTVDYLARAARTALCAVS
jgi:hypothetical protein